MTEINNSNWNDSFGKASRAYSDTSILMHEAIARKAGLSGTDHKYLGLIMQHEQLTAGELAQLTGLTTGAVTGLIDRLEKKKLVHRQADKNDRRKVVIVPDTQRAMKLMTPIFGALQERTRALLSTFDQSEQAVIERYLSSATQLMISFTEELSKTK